MSITAKRGEYRIDSDESARRVTAYSRRYGVTFSPSASGSRFGVTDSGRRYEVRLRNGNVEIKSSGSRWQAPGAAPDPGNGLPAPWGVSYLNVRAGEPLERVPFDMIAVGRGRILAKEEGTDRIFHLQIDELFRTRPRRGNQGLRPGLVGGDRIVPANYFKLDPGFFVPADADGFPVPPELQQDYAGHPASLRFPLFEESMKAETSDGMVVTVQSGVWHLIDSRSPLVIFDLDDLKSIGDAELREVATESRLREVIEQLFQGKKGEIEEGIVKRFRQSVGLDDLPDIPLPPPLSSLLDDLADTFRRTANTVGSMEDIPIVGPRMRELHDQLRAGQRALVSLPRQVGRAAEDVAARALAGAVMAIGQGVFPMISEAVAAEARSAIREGGFSSLYYPGIVVLGLLVKDLQDKGALKIVAPAEGDAGGRRGGARRSELRLHIRKTVKALLQDQDSPALRALVEKLVDAGRRKRGVTIANAPPADLPSYEHVRYEPAAQGAAAQERRSIAFRHVLDLGVGYSHWHEHWQADFGGEMHNLLATRPMLQQEQYNLIQYRFLNGPIVDGDGYNDGTTNFYMLVELDRPKGFGRPVAGRSKGRPEAPQTGLGASRYAILWIDEQTYFSQRWRLLHPTIDTAGDLFSIQRVLRDNPEYFRFDIACYWSPLEQGCINGSSRMSVVRQIVALTGRRPEDNAPEIYTICFNYGVCDRSWRWRPMPSAPVYLVLDQARAGDAGRLPDEGRECLYTNTLGLREDATLHLRGFSRAGAGAPLVEGRWLQKYLPADLRHVPEAFELEPGRPARGFRHPWHFISEDAYGRADQFYLYGVYERTVDARCQYYEVDLIADERGLTPAVEDIVGVVWRNEDAGEGGPSPLRIDTINFNWELPRDRDGYLELSKITTDRGRHPSMSMYETTTRFRFLNRRGKGLIAVLFDKRDDELQSASHLPQDTILVAEATLGRGTEATPVRGVARRLHVRFRANRRALRPPMVQRAVIAPVRADGATVGLTIAFWTHQSDDQVRENLWRFSLGALDGAEDPFMIVQGEVFSRFVRQGRPDRPLALGFAAADVVKPEHQYLFRETGLDRAACDAIDRYCTPQGRVAYATSLWFEDVVGHMGTPETLEFAAA